MSFYILLFVNILEIKLIAEHQNMEHLNSSMYYHSFCFRKVPENWKNKDVCTYFYESKFLVKKLSHLKIDDMYTA